MSQKGREMKRCPKCGLKKNKKDFYLGSGCTKCKLCKNRDTASRVQRRYSSITTERIELGFLIREALARCGLSDQAASILCGKEQKWIRKLRFGLIVNAVDCLRLMDAKIENFSGHLAYASKKLKEKKIEIEKSRSDVGGVPGISRGSQAG
jgi:hypothetical protein